VLLAVGWLTASLREHAGLVREQEAERREVAARIAAAVREGLEELRRREDARPFYLYNHFYSPPEVLAVGDAVAVSPLAADPDDPRVLGHFQVDPGERVRSPYAIDGADPGPRARRIAAIVGAPAFAPLRALSFGEPRRAPDLRLASAGDPAPLTTNIGELSNQAYRDLAPAARLNVQRKQVPITSRNEVSWAALQHQQVANAPPDQVQNAAPVFEQIAAQQYQANAYGDIPQQQAHAPEPLDEPSPQQANADGNRTPRPQQAYSNANQPGPQQAYGNAAQANQPGPQQAYGNAEQANLPGPQEAYSNAEQANHPDPHHANGDTAHAYEQAPQQGRPPRTSPDSPLADPTGAYGQAPSDRPNRSAESLPQEAAVDYTPMAYLALGDQLVLQRVVSHAGTGSVQGVLLDRNHLLDVWLPAVVARHAALPSAPQVVHRADACAAPIPISEQLPDAWLCFAAAPPPPGSLTFQAGALLGLILVVGFGVVVVARAARRADELSAQKTAFVSAVSHELRTPLTTLRMHAELLQEGLVAPASLATIHDDLVRESARLGRLVENVLAVSQLEEGRRVLEPRSGDLATHLQEVIAAQARHVASKGFAPVELELPADPLYLRFDAQAIEQIVVNLLDNALKYAVTGPLSQIRVVLEPGPGRAVLRVQDRGPGVPEAERERVFQRFVRIERASTAHTPGTGLGLSLVRDLARAHGGDAEVRPRPGGGAEFVVWLPA
jgi:signal transduction histidine kinase